MFLSILGGACLAAFLWWLGVLFASIQSDESVDSDVYFRRFLMWQFATCMTAFALVALGEISLTAFFTAVAVQAFINWKWPGVEVYEGDPELL